MSTPRTIVILSEPGVVATAAERLFRLFNYSPRLCLVQRTNTAIDKCFKLPDGFRVNDDDRLLLLSSGSGATEHCAFGAGLIVSVWMGEFGGPNWHTMPVVDLGQNSLTLLNAIRQDGSADTWKVPKQELVRIHDTHKGGHDVAYLLKR